MLTFLINLIALILCGALIGYERQKHNKDIGIRSVTLILLGSYTFCFISTLVGGDPARIIAQIVTGTGFLSGGILFRKENHVENLTTAILVWVLSAVGCLLALNFVVYAIIIIFVMYIILRFYKNLLNNDKETK